VAVYELAGAAEAFCTSSLREIAPLVRLSGHDIGRGVAGELTRHLTTALAALVARECTA
jgi:branched-subunit amino acid aminotransferase/4-amino-4-deoxychorismate lyase